MSGDGAGDGALGGGGQTGANGIGDLGGDTEYVDLDGDAGYDGRGGDAGYVADSDRAAGGAPSAPVSMPKVPPPDASPRRARCASMMAFVRGGTTSRGSSSDGAGAAASAGVQSEAPADRSNAEPDIEKLLDVVVMGVAVGTNAGPGAADTCGWSVIGGWNGIAWRRGAEYCGGGRPWAAAAWAWAWACSAARPLTLRRMRSFFHRPT